MKRIISYCILSFFLCSFVINSTAIAKDKAKITGEYHYTYGDSESLAQAKATCYSMAVRNAIESYKTFVVATSTVKDYQLIKDLIQTVSSGYVENLKTIKETVTGRTIHTTVEGYIIPAELDKLLKREVQKARQPEAVTENGCIKILKVRQKEEFITLTYTVANNFCSDSTIMINYYDTIGDPIKSSVKTPKLRDMYVGELRTIQFLLLKGARSYRVWLPK